MNDRGTVEDEIQPIEYLPGEAHRNNRIIDRKDQLKYIQMTGDQVGELASKLGVGVPERQRKDGVILIGLAEGEYHDDIVLRAFGRGRDDKEAREIVRNHRYHNAGRIIDIIGLGAKMLEGVSNTLLNEEGITFDRVFDTDKKEQDEETTTQLNLIYGETKKFL